MTIPLFDLKAQYESIKPKIDEAVNRVLSSGHYIGGDEVSQFEEEAAGFLGVKFAIGVASGSDALILALRALNIGPGDEVIVPAYSFWSTASAVLHVGATPVFVDVNSWDLNINTGKIGQKITSKTKAIIPVHLYGNPASMKDISYLSTKYHLFVIEDAAQAFGAFIPYFGFAGTIGLIGCYSFFPTKPLGCAGDGGMVVTNDFVINQRIRKLRSHGWSTKYHPEILGYNSRLDALQAAILRAKLPFVREWQRKRRLWAEIYKLRFTNIIQVYDTADGWQNSARHLLVINVQNRGQVIDELKDKGIETGIYYPVPLFRCQPVHKPQYDQEFPAADYASLHSLAIPCYAELTDDQIEYIMETIIEVVINA